MRRKTRKLPEMTSYKLILNRILRARTDARGLVFSRIHMFAAIAYVRW